MSSVLTLAALGSVDRDQYERIFLYCLAWSLGGLLDVSERRKLDGRLRTLSTQMPVVVRQLCLCLLHLCPLT